MRGRRNTDKRLIWLAGNYRKQPEVFVRAASIVANLASPGRATHPNDAFAPEGRLIGDLAHLMTGEGGKYYDLDQMERSDWGEVDPHPDWINEVRGKISLKDYADTVLDSVRRGQYHEGENLDRSRYDKYVGWVGREVKRIIDARNQGTLKVGSGTQRRWDGLERSRAAALARNPRSFSLRWDSDNYHPSAQHQEAVRRFGLIHTSLPSIVDWASAARPNLMQLTYNQAKRQSNAWHRQMAKEKIERSVEPGEVVYQFPDGWTVQKLLTRAHLQQEGAALQHCVGQARHYGDDLAQGRIEIFSLRDPKGVPWVTMEVGVGVRGAPSRRVLVQAKALKNRKPKRELADRIFFWTQRGSTPFRKRKAADLGRAIAQALDLSNRSRPAFVEIMDHFAATYDWATPESEA
jgi:hypothetical protein